MQRLRTQPWSRVLQAVCQVRKQLLTWSPQLIARHWLGPEGSWAGSLSRAGVPCVAVRTNQGGTLGDSYTGKQGGRWKGSGGVVCDGSAAATTALGRTQAEGSSREALGSDLSAGPTPGAWRMRGLVLDAKVRRLLRYTHPTSACLVWSDPCFRSSFLLTWTLGNSNDGSSMWGPVLLVGGPDETLGF